ncbi:MAG TPA: gluconate 2-dehydrogenase subunit 3 family protein [Luteimonas sp.]|nr:gluconate 2-dehydrogenase subunit 3 family protein [Luteimonas sp.]
MKPMTRREALKATALAGGALAVPGLLAACAPDGREAALASRASAAEDGALLDDIADTLLPATAASPGASAAGVGATMALLLADCESLDVQRRVADGLRLFRVACRERGGTFDTLSQAERERLLRELDVQALQAGETHWFASVRELALNAYFSSEIGLTRAMRYVPVPGRYEGCVPLAPGQPAWG